MFFLLIRLKKNNICSDIIIEYRCHVKFVTDFFTLSKLRVGSVTSCRGRGHIVAAPLEAAQFLCFQKDSCNVFYPLKRIRDYDAY